MAFLQQSLMGPILDTSNTNDREYIQPSFLPMQQQQKIDDDDSLAEVPPKMARGCMQQYHHNNMSDETLNFSMDILAAIENDNILTQHREESSSSSKQQDVHEHAKQIVPPTSTTNRRTVRFGQVKIMKYQPSKRQRHFKQQQQLKEVDLDSNDKRNHHQNCRNTNKKIHQHTTYGLSSSSSSLSESSSSSSSLYQEAAFDIDYFESLRSITRMGVQRRLVCG